MELHLVSLWEAVRKKGTDISPHAHNYHELVYYWAGNGDADIGEEHCRFADGCFAVIPPRVSHMEHHHADARVICLEFCGTEDLPQQFRRDSQGIVGRILRDLLWEAGTQHYGYREMIGAKLRELCLYIQRMERTAPDEKNFEYIINYLRENYHEKILLSDCAEQLHISYDYFQHKFKRIMGVSPQQFLIQRRLEAAQQMLLAGAYSCTEIAYRCGFSTSAQFSALFKKTYGLSPLQYQNRQRRT